ncbi:hypothetical protein F5884DRAFT_735516 [Xylogone sp. PMI_703]|nr:hypothetical protein F5884DRAFT_735516 [Xylogone sp. PMI_703]
MEQLPIELRRQILDHLDLSSIKNYRRTSQANASIGEDYLFTPTFDTLLHRNDFHRLLALSQCPKYSYRITALNINLAEMNEFHARHNAYFLQFMRVPEDRDQLREEAWGNYGSVRAQKEEYAENVCKPALLRSVFSKLDNLSSIAVTLATCPFSNELLHQIWRIPSSRALHRVLNTERFTSILSALVETRPALPVTSLSHDRLPFEFFAQRMTLLSSIVDPVFKGLKKLSLSLDYSELPNNGHKLQAFGALARCLKNAVMLEMLDLSFQGRDKIDVSPLIRNLLYDTEANSDPLFPCLRSLKLSSISTTSPLLSSFILLFAGTLQRLEFGSIGVIAPHQSPSGGIHLTEGSFKSLFETVNKEVKGLQPEDEWRGFWLCGDLTAEESGEKWKLSRTIQQSQLEVLYPSD